MSDPKYITYITYNGALGVATNTHEDLTKHLKTAMEALQVSMGRGDIRNVALCAGAVQSLAEALKALDA